jgi:hypothetical protein
LITQVGNTSKRIVLEIDQVPKLGRMKGIRW